MLLTVLTTTLTGRFHSQNAHCYSKTFRDGCNAFFALLHQHSIPLLIFSAGLGDIIEEVIQQRSKFYGNMKIVSNFMKFDESVSVFMLFSQSRYFCVLFVQLTGVAHSWMTASSDGGFNSEARF